MTLSKRSFTFTLSLLCLAAPSLWASQTMGPEVTIMQLDNEQYMPHAAYNSKRDQYLVVWHNRWGGSRDIYGRRLDGRGNLLSWFSISTGPNDRSQPAVAYDEINDRYLVVWSYDFFGDGTDWDVWGRIIPWNGPDPAFTEFAIGSASSSQWNPEVAFSIIQREYLVVWNNDDGVSPLDVSGQRVSLSGGAILGGFVTVATGVGNRTNPDIAYNLARNEYLVTYDLNAADIMATRLTAGGTVLGGESGIAAWPDLESLPAVASCDGTDGYFVAWQSTVGANNNDIYGRFVTGAGAPDGAPIHFESTTVDEQQPDVTCHSGLSEFLVVWEQQYSSSSGPFGIFGQRMMTSRKLSLPIEVRGVWSGETGVCSRPAVAAGDQGFVVAWEHDRQGTSYQDIHGRFVTAGFFEDDFEAGDTSAWSVTVP